jgi:hypothetical protein
VARSAMTAEQSPDRLLLLVLKEEGEAGVGVVSASSSSHPIAAVMRSWRVPTVSRT